ncbi:uncharacterized protein [Eucyclogobius newberryi]|uniref:uncharacterized protein n=1 Tax=Eucyclogobius newberryi TaxID=166745 RepID=UPI003B598792
MQTSFHFTKPRFGGSQSEAVKPNLSFARKRPYPVEAGHPEGDHLESAAPDTGPIVAARIASFEAHLATPLVPRLWSEGLPPEDHKWLNKTLFREGPRGKPELHDHLELWYFPPLPSNVFHQPPTPDHFFAHPLLVWMPFKLWKVKLVCPNSACGGHQLTGAGLHKRARRVLDVDRIYNVVTETLTCTKCRASHVSWSQTVLSQLDHGHRSQFRVILTRKFACDIWVIRLLRQRGLGNSPTRLLKLLKEGHSEEWLDRVSHYTEECLHFQSQPGLIPIIFQDPPEPAVVPSCKWLLSVYSQDILTRLDDFRARITSIYGSILKMDSTKKITKKLSGAARGTAAWVTSVGNEHGQILISVHTAQEGAGLDMMVAGLIRRYRQAGVNPPLALYVDCGCCVEAGTTKLQARFSGWPNTAIRLDIWHFMRRLAQACSTNAHQLYPQFMSRLSSCIFEWDAADLALLMHAKRQQLLLAGHPYKSDAEIKNLLSVDELASHCKRRTRRESCTLELLEKLLQALMGPKGRDSMGVPLFDQERMEHIWRVQRKHVKCIQDPAGVALYIKTGEETKGDYLYIQTGQALQDMHPDSEQTAQLVDELDVQEEEEDEGFLDLPVDPTVHQMEDQDLPGSPAP